MSAFAALFRRELSLAWGRGGGALLALAFYACVTTLLPLASDADPDKLGGLAVGVAWLALALSSLLSLERLFERDFEDGALDLLALGPAPLEAVAVAKCLAQWVTTGAPLSVAAPIAAIALGADPSLAPLLLAVALVGSMAFAFVGGMGASLALGSRRGGVLIAVIVLPLFAPPVIFGGGALTGLSWAPGLLLLCAYTAAGVALCPLAMAAACRNALD